MLGKLLKYDFKSMNRFLIIMHVFLLATSLLVRVTLMNTLQFDAPTFDMTTLILIYLGYFLLYMGVSFGTYIVIAVRFYKNLYSDEGYLSHTLPVSTGQHLASKFISGSIWSLIDSICLLFSAYILFSTPNIIKLLEANKAIILEEFGFKSMSEVYTVMIWVVVYFILGSFFSILLIYLSIAIGQLFSGHAILGSVVAYFALTTVISILYTVIMALAGALTMYGNTLTDDMEYVYSASTYFSKIFSLYGILSFIGIPLFYFITYIIMKKKTNLA